MKHEKAAIPQDWNNTDWVCYSIYWPDSDEWRAVLRTLLAFPEYGRFWRADTGRVLSAKAVGTEIWNRNTHPLTECEGEQPNPPLPPEIIYIPMGGAILEGEESETMGQVVTDVTVNEEGQIVVWFGPCCSKILEFTTGGPDPLPDDPLNPDGEQELTYSACGKANAIAETVFDIVKECHDEIDNFPWQWLGHVENGVGQNLKDVWVINAVSQCIIMTSFDYDFDEVLAEENKQWLKCRLVEMFSDDGNKPDSRDFETAKHIMRNHYSTDPFLFNLWNMAFEALGQTNFDNIAMLGATDETANCDCPGVEPQDPLETPNAEGWYLTGKITPDLSIVSNSNDWVNVHVHGLILPHDVYGLVFDIAPSAGVTFRAKGCNERYGQIIQVGPEAYTNSYFQSSGGVPYNGNIRLSWGNQTGFDSVFGVGLHNPCDNATHGTIQAPELVKGQELSFAFEVGPQNTQRTCLMASIRFLCNANSPHQ